MISDNFRRFLNEKNNWIDIRVKTDKESVTLEMTNAKSVTTSWEITWMEAEMLHAMLGHALV